MHTDGSNTTFSASDDEMRQAPLHLASPSTGKRTRTLVSGLVLSIFPLLLSAQSTVELRPAMTIGHSRDDLILAAFGVASLRGQRIVVTDKLEHRVKLFDRTGRLVGMTGSRGKAKGSFHGPGPVAAKDSLFAVGDFESTRVQVFTDALRFVSELHMDAPVFDLAFDPAGYLWIGTLPNSRGETLFQCDIHGTVLKGVSLAFPADNGFDCVFTMAVGRGGEITIAYMTHNTVEVWDTSGRFLREFHVPGIRARAVQTRIAYSGAPAGVEVPEDNVFLRVAVDPEGNTYLLADQYTEHPARDVYVIDRHGRMTARLLLPERSHAVFLSGGHTLYSIEGSRMFVRVYNLGR
jgi:hypothetical protein